MVFTSISKHPILEGHPDAGFVPARPTPHQDSTQEKPLIGVQRTDTGKWRHVEPGGKVEDDRDSAGSGERFVAGPGSTVTTTSSDGVPHVFMVA